MIFFEKSGPGIHIQSNMCLAATQGKHKKWLLKAGGYLMEVNISTILRTFCLAAQDRLAV